MTLTSAAAAHVVVERVSEPHAEEMYARMSCTFLSAVSLDVWASREKEHEATNTEIHARIDRKSFSPFRKANRCQTKPAALALCPPPMVFHSVYEDTGVQETLYGWQREGRFAHPI